MKNKGVDLSTSCGVEFARSPAASGWKGVKRSRFICVVANPTLHKLV